MAISRWLRISTLMSMFACMSCSAGGDSSVSAALNPLGLVTEISSGDVQAYLDQVQSTPNMVAANQAAFGKSTFSDMISGLDQLPDSTITIAGVKLSHLHTIGVLMKKVAPLFDQAYGVVDNGINVSAAKVTLSELQASLQSLADRIDGSAATDLDLSTGMDLYSQGTLMLAKGTDAVTDKSCPNGVASSGTQTAEKAACNPSGAAKSAAGGGLSGAAASAGVNVASSAVSAIPVVGQVVGVLQGAACLGAAVAKSTSQCDNDKTLKPSPSEANNRSFASVAHH